MIPIGSIYRTRINGHSCRVQVEARLEIREHVCGRFWKTWQSFRVRNLDTGKRVVRKASQLRPLREVVGS